MSQLLNSRFVKRDAEVIRVTEQQFEGCREANESGADFSLEPKEGKSEHLIFSSNQSKATLDIKHAPISSATGAMAQHFYVHVRNASPEATVDSVYDFLQRAFPINIHKLPPMPNNENTLFVVELQGESIRLCATNSTTNISIHCWFCFSSVHEFRGFISLFPFPLFVSIYRERQPRRGFG